MDSYCERDTSPREASIHNVGMTSLSSSKLYGAYVPTANCTNTGQSTQANCIASVWDHDSNATTPDVPGIWIPVSQGPGKDNFIGFGGDNCPGTRAAGDIISLEDVITPASTCTLDVTSYKMGVFGHISGNSYIGIQVDNNGVIAERAESANGQTAANATCV